MISQFRTSCLKHFLLLAIVIYLCIFLKWSISLLETYLPEIGKENASLISMKDNGDWSKVDNDTYILSAYWETRDVPLSPFVRIIGIALREGEREMLCNCVLKFEDGNDEYVAVYKEVIVEHWRLPYSAVYFMCRTSNDVRPVYVKMQCNESDSDWKNVRKLTGEHPNSNVALCVRPFFRGYPNPHQLAEFIAFYELMGISRFTFYDMGTSRQIKTFINELKLHVNIELIPWSFPTHLRIWQLGQLAFIQECIYRHMSEFEFVAIVDLDEFLLPKNYTTLHNLTQGISSDVGSIMFLNAMFCKSKKQTRPTDFLTQNWTARSLKWYGPNDRSKFIARNRALVMGNIHYPAVMVRGFKNRVLKHEEGLLHHYRDAYCRGVNKTEDKTALKYGNQLSSHPVLKICKSLRK